MFSNQLSRSTFILIGEEQKINIIYQLVKKSIFLGTNIALYKEGFYIEIAMTKLIHALVLISAASLVGCKSTETKIGHYGDNKISSDYAFMLMLANRPQTEDQKMMNLFARRSYHIENNVPQLYYLPVGQENPVNFLSFDPSVKTTELPAKPFALPQHLVTIKGPKTAL